MIFACISSAFSLTFSIISESFSAHGRERLSVEISFICSFNSSTSFFEVSALSAFAVVFNSFCCQLCFREQGDSSPNSSMQAASIFIAISSGMLVLRFSMA